MKRRKAVKRDRHWIDMGTQMQKQKDILARLLSIWITTLGLEHWDADALYHLEAPDNWSQHQVGGCSCS